MFTPKPTTGATTRFVHDRFGVFFHWGLYDLRQWARTALKLPWLWRGQNT